MPLNLDPMKEVLPEFRRFAESYVKKFEVERDRIRDLLGAEYKHQSGVFREELLRQFFQEILPSGLAIDTGYIHGFSSKMTSKQLDIIIWDSSRFPAVFRAGQFVVVCPESVVAVLEVKSKMDLSTIRAGVSNLQSVIDIDFFFRARKVSGGEDVAPPIFKSLVCFDGPAISETVVKTLGEECSKDDYLSASVKTAISVALKNIDPFDPKKEHTWPIERAFVDMVVSIDSAKRASYYRGWGPPQDLEGKERFRPGFRRLPFYYAQKNVITTPIEKLVYSVMAAVNRYLKVPVSSILSAWGDFDPISCMRFGDAAELDEEICASAIDPEKFQ